MTAEPYVCVIGAASVDLTGHSHGAIVARESNPGSLHVSFGGVARNIAENLARLELPVHLVTVLGDDEFGQQLQQHASHSRINMHAHTIAGGVTPAYVCINDANGELAVAVAAMALLDQLSPEILQHHAAIIRAAKLCVIDANLDQALIGYLLQHFDQQDFFVDAVSIAKAPRLQPWLGRFRTIKLNRAEAACLSGVPIEDRAGLQGAADYFLDQGLEQVFISLGQKGLFYADRQDCGSLRSEAGIQTISTMGAGDAMMAGLVAASLGGENLEQAAFQAMAAAAITLQHQGAVNPGINPAALRQMRKTIHHA